MPAGRFAREERASRSPVAGCYSRGTVSEAEHRIATPFRLGEWTVEPALNRITREGEVVRLEPRAMEVLVCLAGRPGLPLSRHELLDAVWRTTFVDDHRVTGSRSLALGDEIRLGRELATLWLVVAVGRTLTER